MNPKVAPRPQNCLCGALTRPQIRQYKHAGELVTEAHWVCPRCTQRFKIGEVSREVIKDEQAG